MGLKRAIAFYAALVLLVGVIFVGRGVASAPSYACSYPSYEHWNYARTQFWSSYLGAYDYLYSEIITWNGQAGSGVGCGQYKKYEVEQWTSGGTPGYFFTEARAWVCGTYWGSWVSYTGVTYSAEIYYDIYCGRQADNAYSYFHDNYGGENVSVYVTQG